MSDNVFGERFYGTRTPAWHSKGQVFKKALKPSKAVVQVGCDYNVQKYPLFAYPVKGQRVASSYFSIMRSPTADDPEWREFGMAKGKYEIVQNTELATILDPLAETWPLETMGALDSGKTFFATLDAGNSEVMGDPIKQYFMLVDVKDGGTRAKLAYTPVRVVCQNTLVTGLKQATVTINVQHITGVRAQLEARVNLIAKMQEAILNTNQVFTQMAETRVKVSLADEFFAGVYKSPDQPADAQLADYDKETLGDVLFQKVQDQMYAYDYYTRQAGNLQGIAIDLYEKLNDEYPAQAGSVWHLYNAVVESADYRLGGQDPEASALFGARAREKTRAFRAATSLLK